MLHAIEERTLHGDCEDETCYIGHFVEGSRLVDETTLKLVRERDYL